MELSQLELKRALSLQRRLKLLRFWNRIGYVLCWPWTFYKDRETKWREELQVLYNKKFLLKDRENTERRVIGSPLERELAARELKCVKDVADVLTSWAKKEDLNYVRV